MCACVHVCKDSYSRVGAGHAQLLGLALYNCRMAVHDSVVIASFLHFSMPPDDPVHFDACSAISLAHFTAVQVPGAVVLAGVSGTPREAPDSRVGSQTT